MIKNTTEIVLGIHDGHHANASVFADGELICAIAEERITRQKSEYGYPKNAIEYCLRFAKLNKKDIDIVALSTINLPPKYSIVKRATTFTVDDYYKEQKKYWYPRFYEDKNPKYLNIFSDKAETVDSPYDYSFIENEDDSKGMLKSRLSLIEKHLGIDKQYIKVFDHSSCHAYYGYFWYTGKNKKFLVVTADGCGDGVNGSIWIGEKGQLLTNLIKTGQCNIGRIYRYITLLLGMKPNEHEFKVMGLAPYAKEIYAKKSYEIFESTLNVDGLNFYYQEKIKDHFWYFKDKLESHRFDNIAYGLQKYTENLLGAWVKNAAKETRISNVIMTGGVALNVKANKYISELNEVKDLIVPPGPNDESLSIGACFKYIIENKQKKYKFRAQCNPYLGASYSDNFIKKILINYDNIKISNANAKIIAKLISKEKVIARFTGRMEFGPRALGNRSILADPRDTKVTKVINDMVKMRDFWMPFCPVIISDKMGDYLNNDKQINSLFMNIAYDSTEHGKYAIPAAIHPSDHTARPQIIDKNINNDLYEIISEFQKLTDVGCLLNTSLNLHGEPIVESPEDAISTFKRSGLNHMVFNDKILISKHNPN